MHANHAAPLQKYPTHPVTRLTATPSHTAAPRCAPPTTTPTRSRIPPSQQPQRVSHSHRNPSNGVLTHTQPPQEVLHSHRHLRHCRSHPLRRANVYPTHPVTRPTTYVIQPATLRIPFRMTAAWTKLSPLVHGEVKCCGTVNWSKLAGRLFT